MSSGWKSIIIVVIFFVIIGIFESTPGGNKFDGILTAIAICGLIGLIMDKPDKQK